MAKPYYFSMKDLNWTHATWYNMVNNLFYEAGYRPKKGYSLDAYPDFTNPNPDEPPIRERENKKYTVNNRAGQWSAEEAVELDPLVYLWYHYPDRGKLDGEVLKQLEHRLYIIMDDGGWIDKKPEQLAPWQRSIFNFWRLLNSAMCESEEEDRLVLFCGAESAPRD